MLNEPPTNAVSSTKEANQSAIPTLSEPLEGRMISVGTLLIAIGIIAVIVAFSFDVSVETSYETTGVFSLPSRVANIDKISVREMILSAGGFSFLSGIVLFSAGRICRALQKMIPGEGPASFKDNGSEIVTM